MWTTQKITTKNNIMRLGISSNLSQITPKEKQQEEICFVLDLRVGRVLAFSFKGGCGGRLQFGGPMS